MKSTVSALKDNYCLYRQRYVMMTPNYIKTVCHHFKDKTIESHLDGKYALAVFAGDKVTRFITFDVDGGGKAAVRTVIAGLQTLGFPQEMIYVSTSGKKGYHVDMFFEPYIYNDKAKNIYDLLIWITQLDPKNVEFRPTPTQAVKIPLGLHAKTRNRCWFLDPSTLEPIERMDYVCEIKRIDGQIIHDILRKWNKKHWNELYADMVCNPPNKIDESELEYDFNRREEYFASHQLTAPNTRHDMMLKIAKDIRLCGANKYQIAKFLKGWYYQQDPEYIESSEQEVMDDIDALSEWAEECVPIIKKHDPPNDPKPIVFTKEDINYILMAPTSVARRTALLLWSYCKLYGASHISYAAIADTIGCVERSATTAVNSLIKNKIINKESGGLHVRNGRMIKQANTYFIPKKRLMMCPYPWELVADEFEYRGKIDKSNFDKFYYSVLGGLCTDKYLAKYLTKPELEEVQKVRAEYVAENADSDAERLG